jgi:hypothetical protein
MSCHGFKIESGSLLVPLGDHKFERIPLNVHTLAALRVRRKLARKYGQRRQERLRQILNRVSKRTVADARRNGEAIAFEEISGIRKLYRKGNG